VTHQAAVQIVAAIAILAGLPQLCIAMCVSAWKDIPDAKRHAVFVFSGTVVEERAGQAGRFVAFDVDRVWKGPHQRRYELELYRRTMDSIYNFHEGEAYLVFVYRPGPYDRIPPTAPPLYMIDPCTPTRPLRDAQPELAQLGTGSRVKRQK
jgi:hypothetical protein